MKNTGMTRPNRLAWTDCNPERKCEQLGDSVEFFLDHDSKTLGVRQYTATVCKMYRSVEELSYFKDSIIREMKKVPCFVQAQNKLRTKQDIKQVYI
ncbi:hypothetical protein [Paenibacillus polymyxa]|uniref:hypothetical protein n=1 Tax=Paenibacillus polymyxa TaxID=1406 RepID=UPI000F515A68|nr:hypothetical protein [Paenibacillus polymyxa]RPE06782.1 hypothetical protein EG487_08375 [Paenibacillus polymyxa]